MQKVSTTLYGLTRLKKFSVSVDLAIGRSRTSREINPALAICFIFSAPLVDPRVKRMVAFHPTIAPGGLWHTAIPEF